VSIIDIHEQNVVEDEIRGNDVLATQISSLQKHELGMD
jgi:hypothetical protein